MKLEDKVTKTHERTRRNEKHVLSEDFRFVRNLIHGMMMRDSTLWGLPPPCSCCHGQMKRSLNACLGSCIPPSSGVVCFGS